MSLSQILFMYHALVIVLLALLVVTRRNPVHSVIFMLVMFFHLAGLYLILNAEFIAALQVIVYAGAILVLFLFVIFLLNIKHEIGHEIFVRHWPTAALCALIIFLVIGRAVRGFVPEPSGQYTVQKIQELTHTKAIGTILYTHYIFPFEVASIVLLVAIVGAITLAKKNLRT